MRLAPSRAKFFAAYSDGKEKLNGCIGSCSTQHMISTAVACVTAFTAANRTWPVKNRSRPDARSLGERQMGVLSTFVKRIRQPARGFYRAVSASYRGVLQAAVPFGYL